MWPCHTVEYDDFVEVNLPHAIRFGALCGAQMVTYPSDFRGVETLVLYRVVRGMNERRLGAVGFTFWGNGFGV